MALQTAGQLKEIDALVTQIGNMTVLRDGAEQQVFDLGARISKRIEAGSTNVEGLATKQLSWSAEVERYNDLLLHLAKKLAAALQADIGDFARGDAF